MLAHEDPSEEQSLSRYIGRLERRGIVVQNIEHGAITRENFVWGWGKGQAEKIVTNWFIHFGGELRGGVEHVRQTVYFYPLTGDPRDEGHPRKRYGVEYMPQGREFGDRLKVLMRTKIQNDDDED